MKKSKIIITSLLFLMFFSIPVFARDKGNDMTMFMGEVLEVQRNEKDNNLMVRTNGYINGCEVYKEELIAIISNESLSMNKDCSTNDKSKVEKIKVETFDIQVGDNVFMILNEAMTKSIPPQVGAKLIKVTRIR